MSDLPCGCRYIEDTTKVPSWPQIVFCPLHTAAQEMLEELKSAVTWLYGHWNEEGQTKCRGRIESLIAKAEGTLRSK